MIWCSIVQFNNYGWFSAACNEMYHCKSMVYFKQGPGVFAETPGEKCQYAVLADPAAVADVHLTIPGKNPVTPVISGPAGYLIDSNLMHDVPEVYVTSSGDGGGDPDGGIYGWSISETDTKIFGFENSSGFHNFANDFFINRDYPLFANGAGLDNVPPSAIGGRRFADQLGGGHSNRFRFRVVLYQQDDFDADGVRHDTTEGAGNSGGGNGSGGHKSGDGFLA